MAKKRMASDVRNRPALLASRLVLVLFISCAPSAFAALEPLEDSTLADINARDGLSYAIRSAPGISINQFNWCGDSSTTGINTCNSNTTTDPKYGKFTLSGLRIDGLTGAGMTPGPVTGTIGIDVGASAVSGSTPALSLAVELDRFRLGGNFGGVYDGTCVFPSACGYQSNGGFSIINGLDAGRSYGEWSLVADMDFRLLNIGGLFNRSSTNGSLYFALNDASLFYRQNWYYHANIALDHLDFLWAMPQGSIGLDDNGLRIAGDVNFGLNFDLVYKFDPSQDLTRTYSAGAPDMPLVNTGWTGNLYDVELLVRSGGIWDTAANAATGGSLPTGRSEGMNIGLRWNYKKNPGDTSLASDMRLQLGRPGGNHALLEFGDWRNMQGYNGNIAGRYGFDFPNVTFDAIPTYNTAAGTALPPGALAAGGLCWGGTQTTGTACDAPLAGKQLLVIPPGRITGYNADVDRLNAGTFAYLIRNGNVLSWSNQVKVSADTMTTESHDWGLIWTLANLNANVYFYPGGSDSHQDPGNGAYSRNSGIMMDLLLTTQSFGNWSDADPAKWKNGTHFMIADTNQPYNGGTPVDPSDDATGVGVGLLGTSFLIAADDLRLWLKNGSGYAGGIDLFSPRTRTHIRGLFGGSTLPMARETIKAANIDMNLEGLWNARLSPASTGTYLGYSAALRLRSPTLATNPTPNEVGLTDATGTTIASGRGTYISIEEPGRPGVDLRMGDYNGDIAWTDGRLEVIARNEGSDPRPQLVLANRILVGQSAASRMTDAVTGSSLGDGGAAGKTLTSNISFGGDHMLTMAIPSGSLYGSITLMPKQ